MKLRISSSARVDLLQIWYFSAAAWGNEHADLYIDKMILRMAWLTVHRGRWKSLPDILEYLCAYTETSHVIYFMEDQGSLLVLRVLDGRVPVRSAIMRC